MEDNSAGIQELSTAEIQKQETFKYNHATIHWACNNIFHCLNSSTCGKVISEPLNRIYFTSYVQFAIYIHERKKLNPLTPKSGHLQISSYNNTPESNKNQGND